MAKDIYAWRQINLSFRSANFDEILVECFLNGPLLKLCQMTPLSNQDGRQAKNRKGMKFLKSLKLQSQSKPNFTEMILGWSLFKMCPMTQTSDQYGRQAKNRKRGIKFENLLKRHSKSKPNFTEMILGWFLFKIVSDDPNLRSI